MAPAQPRSLWRYAFYFVVVQAILFATTGKTHQLFAAIGAYMDVIRPCVTPANVAIAIATVVLAIGCRLLGRKARPKAKTPACTDACALPDAPATEEAEVPHQPFAGAEKNAYEFTVSELVTGTPVSLKRYVGRVSLIVNVASA